VTARAFVRALVVASALGYGVAGCAVGRFVTGAPSARPATTTPALLARRCSNCHATPDPASMTGAEWQAALERMKPLMKLSASEWDSLGGMASDDSRR